jgi:hypothetical protein
VFDALTRTKSQRLEASDRAVSLILIISRNPLSNARDS